MISSLAHIGLPITLATMMFTMGLQLRPNAFVHHLLAPKTIALGLLGQLLIPPLIAVGIVTLIQLPVSIAAGLILVSLCPGGASSNLIAHLCKGDGALSIFLTTVMSFLSPLLMPAMLLFLFDLLAFSNHFKVKLPYLETVGKLAILTILPVTIGMIVKHYAPTASHALAKWLNKLTPLALLTFVSLLYWVNRDTLPSALSATTLTTLFMASFAMLTGYYFGLLTTGNPQYARTFAIEIGLQNASIAIFIAISIMEQPAISISPLAYGILMNIPAFLWMAWIKQKNSMLPAETTAN